MKSVYSLVVYDIDLASEDNLQSLVTNRFEEKKESVDIPNLNPLNYSLNLWANTSKSLNLSECLNINNIKLLVIKSETPCTANIVRGTTEIFRATGNTLFYSIDNLTAFVDDPNNNLVLTLNCLADSEVKVYLAGS